MQNVLIHPVTKEIIDCGTASLHQCFMVAEEIGVVDQGFYICEVGSEGYYKQLNK